MDSVKKGKYDNYFEERSPRYIKDLMEPNVDDIITVEIPDEVGLPENEIGYGTNLVESQMNYLLQNKYKLRNELS